MNFPEFFFAHQSAPYGMFPSCVPGVFTGAIIRMISDIRANGGTVDLRYCGKFTLAEDLSDISDMTSIDLSGISSLEGEPLGRFPGDFFCVPVRIVWRMFLLTFDWLPPFRKVRGLQGAWRSPGAQYSLL